MPPKEFVSVSLIPGPSPCAQLYRNELSVADVARAPDRWVSVTVGVQVGVGGGRSRHIRPRKQ